MDSLHFTHFTSLTHFTHSLTHSLHSLTSLTHSLTSLTHSLTFTTRLASLAHSRRVGSRHRKRRKEAGALVAGALWLLACYRSRASALSIWWLLPQYLKNLKNFTFHHHSQPISFYFSSDFLKWQKNRQKSSQKEHPAPQKVKFCKKKSVFFT